MFAGHRITRVEPRRPSRYESAMVGVLLAPLQSPALVCQAAAALVVEVCECGCPSFWLDVPSGACSPAQIEMTVPVEGSASDVDGVEIAVLLHLRSGWLDEVEFVRGDGEHPRRLPLPEELKIVALTRESL